MITERDLCRYRSIKEEVEQLKEQLSELEASMVVPRVPELTGMPGGGSGGADKIGNVVAKAEKLKDLYCRKLAVLLDLQAEIEKAIDVLEEDERQLVRLYYFKGLTWEQASGKMECSLRNVYRLRASILQKIGA